MDKPKQKHPKTQNPRIVGSEEVSSMEWKLIHMTDQEQDIISRMHKLVGDRWALIAGRIPGRKPEEVERYWLMANTKTFQDNNNNMEGTKI